VTYFARYHEPDSGFATVAGREDGLSRIVLAGQLAAGEGGPVHLHHGEEILRILSGELDVTVAPERRRCSGRGRGHHSDGHSARFQNTHRDNDGGRR
jgi:hypothetical protein